MRTNNLKACQKFYDIFSETINGEYEHYRKEFKFRVGRVMYEYGCFDIYDYDLYKTLIECGIDTKAVTEYTKVLDWGCTYRHRENIRNTYVNLVTNTLRYYRQGKLKIMEGVN